MYTLLSDYCIGALCFIFFFKDKWYKKRQIPREVPELSPSGRSLFSASCSLRYTRPCWNSLNIILGTQENSAKQACQRGERWIFHQWASTHWVSGQCSHSWADVQCSYTLQLMWTYWPLCHWLQGRWQRFGIWELLSVKGAALESVAPAFFSHFPAHELVPGQRKALTAHPSSVRQWWNTCYCLLGEWRWNSCKYISFTFTFNFWLNMKLHSVGEIYCVWGYVLKSSSPSCKNETIICAEGLLHYPWKRKFIETRHLWGGNGLALSWKQLVLWSAWWAIFSLQPGASDICMPRLSSLGLMWPYRSVIDSF